MKWQWEPGLKGKHGGERLLRVVVMVLSMALIFRHLLRETQQMLWQRQLIYRKL